MNQGQLTAILAALETQNDLLRTLIAVQTTPPPQPTPCPIPPPKKGRR